MSQSSAILAYMEAHGGITPADALREFGCMRLAARICDLKRAGHRIKCDLVDVRNRAGEVCHVARYSMIEEPVQATLF